MDFQNYLSGETLVVKEDFMQLYKMQDNKLQAQGFETSLYKIACEAMEIVHKLDETCEMPDILKMF